MSQMPDDSPESATYDYDLLEMFHEGLPDVVRDWDVLLHEYDALLANLPLTRTDRLSTKQHRRLSALLSIYFSVSPRPLDIHDACAAVLHHPRSAPGGAQAAIDMMCASLEGLEEVAAYFESLPHGPCLLPGVVQDLLTESAPDNLWYREMLENAEYVCTWHLADPEDRALARDLGDTLRAAALRAPRQIRDAILRDALQSARPSIVAWGQQSLAATQPGTAL